MASSARTVALIVKVSADAAEAAKGVDKASSKLSKFGTWAKRIGLAVGGSLAAAVLWKGFDRLRAIDDAQARLKGLGYTAKQIKGIMKDATAAVKGTAFGLDDAAAAASGALASGIKPGKQLTAYLALVGDAATQAGTDFSSMAQMMGKVQGQGKLTGDVIQQMADNGLYVVPMLAKAFGKTQSEIQKMVSSGEISSKQFQKVLQQNIGGSAQKAGQTVSGSMKNIGAALGRVGAALLGGVFAQLPGIFAKMTKALDAITPVAAKVGTAIGKAFRAVGTVIGAAVKVVETLVKWMKDPVIAGGAAVLAGIFIAALAPIIAFNVQALLAIARMTVLAAVENGVATATKAWAIAQKLLNASLLTNPVFLIVAGVIALGAALVIAYKKSETFRKVVDATWAAIKSATVGVANFLKATWNAVWGSLRSGVSAVANFIRNAWTIIRSINSSVAGAVRSAWQSVTTALANLATRIRNGFTNAFDAVKRAAGNVASAIAKPFDAVRNAIDRAVDAVQSLISWLGKIKVPKIKIPGVSKLLGATAPAVARTPGAPVVRGLGAAPVIARPAVASSGSGITINITGAIDPESTARQVRKLLNGFDIRHGTPLQQRGLRTV